MAIFVIAARGPGRAAGREDHATPALQASVVVIPIRYVPAVDVPGLLPSDIPTGAVTVIPERNSIVVKGSSEFIEQVRRLVTEIDRQPVNVTIDALIVEYRDGNVYRAHLSAAAPHAGGRQVSPLPDETSNETMANTLDVSTMDEASRARFDASLQSLIAEGRASIKARPILTTVSGRAAAIVLTREEFFRVSATGTNESAPASSIRSIASGITLNVAPFVNDAGDRVTLQVSVQDSRVVSRDVDGLPTMAVYSASSRVQIRPGETLMVLGWVPRATGEGDRSREGSDGASMPSESTLSSTAHASFTALYITPRIESTSE